VPDAADVAVAPSPSTLRPETDSTSTAPTINAIDNAIGPKLPVATDPVLSRSPSPGTQKRASRWSRLFSSSSSAPPKPVSTVESSGGAEIRRKLVIVGDSGVGKTPLLIVFCKGTFPEVWVPTVFENYVADIVVDNKHVELALWDTSGLGDYDRLRPLSYPDAHVIVLCFSLANYDSYDNILETVSHLPKSYN
jgi:Ras homolog gene family, member A